MKMVGMPVNGRESTDEEIWEYASGCLASSWHMCSTVRMGKEGDDSRSCETDFRVRGVGKLRVVDLSILPLLPK